MGRSWLAAGDVAGVATQAGDAKQRRQRQQGRQRDEVGGDQQPDLRRSMFTNLHKPVRLEVEPGSVRHRRF
jgi:hypothetical protein